VQSATPIDGDHGDTVFEKGHVRGAAGLVGERGQPVAAGEVPESITTSLARAAAEWSGDESPNDDMTFLVLRTTERA